ncbi:hypothetical protein ACJRO7_022767 [Eucalyptus globulus]|uniref:Uncharacterized protein n=1 Tax=Eucalyptus globulus TaxID=34317 RepID=A0ABD3K200_EUCGL
MSSGALKLQKEKQKVAETKRSKPNKREKEETENRLKPFAGNVGNVSKVKRLFHEKPPTPAGVRKRKVFDSDSPPPSKDSKMGKRKVFDSDSPPMSKDYSEQGEKSSITEEHEQPVGYLSDGSKSSSNKSRQDASTSSIERRGNILRIRLKRAAAPESPFVGQPECTTSGRTDFSANFPSKQHLHETSHAPCQINMPSATAKEEAKEALLVKPEVSPQLDTAFQTVPPSARNELSEIESTYETLIEHWVPLPLDHGLGEPDDEDWLFKTKRVEGKSPKRPKVGDDTAISFTWPPQAHYLPEAEIYALPYTVPF